MPLLLIFLIVNGEAKKLAAVEKVRFASYKEHTRVVVDLNGPVEYTQESLSNPRRIYFDLKDCIVSKKVMSSLAIKNDILHAVRVAQFNRNTVRVVFDINKTKSFYAFMLEKPYRLVVDVYASENRTSSGRLVPQKKLSEKKPYEIRTIVIDPGHGGKDPGAIGPRGLREKDITLYVGKRLGKILRQKYDVEIIYTRDKDIFVPLNDRTEIANSSKADLFISIHTNASKRRNTRGVETYFLNWTNNKEAMRVAARENKVSIKKMQKMQNALQMILQDLARNNKREESMRLAHSIQNSMVRFLKQDYPGIEDLGVKYALFYVLVGAEMPSILAEISFISNRQDEMRLATRKYKNRIAEAIANGINAYMSESTLIVTPAHKSIPEG